MALKKQDGHKETVETPIVIAREVSPEQQKSPSKQQKTDAENAKKSGNKKNSMSNDDSLQPIILDRPIKIEVDELI